MKSRSNRKLSLDTIETLAPILRVGGVGVLPTDTLYGIVGSALEEKVVERIYKLRKRNKTKPLIILIGSLNDLDLFFVKLDKNIKNILKKVWPGKVSVVLSCPQESLRYLHRGNKTLAFRMPDNDGLRELIKKTGPLVAPSANFEGEKSAETIEQAKKYFENKVEFYVDFGTLRSKPSTLVSIKGGEIEVLRQGAVRI